MILMIYVSYFTFMYLLNFAYDIDLRVSMGFSSHDRSSMVEASIGSLRFAPHNPNNYLSNNSDIQTADRWIILERKESSIHVKAMDSSLTSSTSKPLYWQSSHIASLLSNATVILLSSVLSVVRFLETVNSVFATANDWGIRMNASPLITISNQ